MKKREIKVLEVTPIEKIERVNRLAGGRTPLPKFKYGDVMTIKIDGVTGFWARCRPRREWECMITGKPIKPGEPCYRPLAAGVQLWYPENRISAVVVKALLDLEPADNRPYWQGVTDQEIVEDIWGKRFMDD